MADFFINQFDFILFLHSLSFLILAFSSFSIAVEKRNKFPWFWLGIFGVLYAVTGWIDLFALVVSENVFLGLARTLFTIASFMALFEFARRSHKVNSGKEIPVWWYIPVLLPTFIYSIYNPSELNGALRYFIGLPSGIFSAFVVYEAARRESDKSLKIFLFGLFAAAVCYALTTIIAAPKGNILFSSWLNRESFFAATGLPVQALRTLLVSAAALFIWLYYNYSGSEKDELRGISKIKKAMAFSMPALIVIMILAGWMITNRIGNYALDKIISDSETDINILSMRITAELGKTEEAAGLMSSSPGIISASSAWNRSDITKANLVLDRYKEAFHASVCYILNNEGVAVASSNRNDSDSFVGSSYAFRPYFKYAIAGSASDYFAVGATSRSRGYYAASPVKEGGGNIIGAAVIKKDLKDFASDFKQYPYSFLTDPNGIIFMSSKPELVLMSLWPVSDSVSVELKKSDQFQKSSFSPIFPKKIEDHKYVTLGGEKFVFNSVIINKEGWRIASLVSTAAVLHYRFSGIFATFFVLILVMVLFVIFSKERAIYDERLKLAEALAEEKFIFSHTKDFVYRHDTKGVFNYISPSIEQITGYTADDWKTHYSTYFTDNPDNKKAVEYTEEALRTGKEYPAYQLEIYHKDGRRIYLEVKEQPFFENGRVAGIVGVARNISERKRAEEALLEAERRFRDTLEDIDLIAVQLDMDGNITFCNNFLLKLTGWKKEDIFSRNWFDIFIPTADRQKVKNVFFELAMEQKIDKYLHYENIILTKSGEERIILWVNVVLRNAAGEIVGISSLGVDMTERRRLEDKLASLSRAVEQSPVSVVITDTKGDIEYVNPKFTDLTGYSLEESIGRNPRMLKTGETPPEEYKRLWETITGGNEWKGEFHNKKKNSELYWEFASISPIRNAKGEITHFLAVKEDITERKKAEEELVRLASFPALNPNPIIEIDSAGRIIYMNPTAYRRFSGRSGTESLDLVLETLKSHIGEIRGSGRKDIVIETEVHSVVYEQHASYISGSNTVRTYLVDITERRRLDRIKDDFVATVSHELRTPLSITKEGINLVLDGIVGKVTEEQAKVLATSKDNVDRLSRIINELLDISKIEAGKMILDKRKINIVTVAKNTIESFRRMANAKKLDIRLVTAEDDIILYADQDKITQIFINLINNALKFTDAGYIEVSIKEIAGEVECSVKDTGIGISDEDLPKLFGKFQQFGRTAGAGEKGTGLGLSIAKKIVDMHNGEIWAESEPGKGTKITFVLPRQML